jgi:hypothetical protein
MTKSELCGVGDCRSDHRKMLEGSRGEALLGEARDEHGVPLVLGHEVFHPRVGCDGDPASSYLGLWSSQLLRRRSLRPVPLQDGNFDVMDLSHEDELWF